VHECKDDAPPTGILATHFTALQLTKIKGVNRPFTMTAKIAGWTIGKAWIRLGWVEPDARSSRIRR